MAENKINIQLQANLKQTISEQQKSYQTLKNTIGKNADPAKFAKTDSLLNTLLAKAGKANLNAKELSSLREGVVKFALEMQKLTKSFTTINPTVEKTSKVLNDLTEKGKKLSDEQKELQKVVGTTKRNGKEVTGITKAGIREILGNYDVSKISGKGSGKNIAQMSDQALDTFMIKGAKGDFTEYSENAENAYNKIVEVSNTYIQRLKDLPGEISANNAEIDKEKQNLMNADVNEGNIGISSLPEEQQELVKTNEILNNIYTQMSQMITDTNQLRNAQTVKEAEAIKKQNEGQGTDVNPFDAGITKNSSSLGKAFKQFTLYNIALRSIKKAAREAAVTIQELDKSLTEQAMVTGKTKKQTLALLKDYQALSAQLGATTKEVASVATEYMRQGKNTEDAMKLTEAAISSAKVAAISASESVNYLTTALNGFRLSAEDAMLVSDKFAAVAANAAVSYDEIATALSKVASQANLAGMSIDYTTALLAKGIETTREAPETIGTALKTIIARMRELSDYGETLTDGTDINNVETQLAYVGIALRTTSGELRSTEDVLDDLGKKWDTLNTNQQAAVAKALAGTRQQSRLIAMMSDYERVTELQEISARSAGATMAQMETYLTGMEAALNKVSVAWEKIVTNFTNNDFIIWIINGFAEILDNMTAMIPLFGVLVLLSLNAAKNKFNEYLYNKEIHKIEIERNINANKLAIAKKKVNAESLKQKVLDAKAKLDGIIKLKNERQIYLTKLQQKKAEGANVDGSIKRVEALIAQTEAQENQAKIEYEAAVQEEKANAQEISNLEKQNTLLATQQSALGGIVNGWGMLGKNMLSIVTMIPTMIQSFSQSIAVMKAQKKQADATGRSNAGNSAAVIPVIGWIIWAVIMGASIFSTIVSLISFFLGSIKSATERTSELSAEIYTLNNTKIELQKAINAIKEYDNTLIKTKEDAEQLTEALKSVEDSLPEDADAAKEAGFSEEFNKKEYAKLTDTDLQRKFLTDYKAKIEAQLEKDRQEQLDIYNKESKKRNNYDYMNNATNIQAIRSIAVARMQEYVDKSKIDNSDLEALATELVGNLSISKAAEFAEKNGKAWNNFIDSLNALEDVEIDGTTYSVIELLQSDSAPLEERARAYEQINEKLKEINMDSEIMASYQKEYSFLGDLVNKLGYDVLKYADAIGLSAQKINDLYSAGEKLVKQGLLENEEEWTDNFYELMQGLESSNGQIGDVIEELFATQLSAFEKGTTKYENAYNQFVNTFADLVSIGMLNMGQNLESFSNSISIFYEKAQEWSTMSETDKTSFVSDYADMFGGADGAELLRAFENGDYQRIEKALKENDALQKKLTTRIADIDRELAIEEARVGEARNEAYIKYLKEWKDKLEDTTDLFKADLSLWVEQENAQLDAYKEYLQSQQDALEKSLDKRKEAYEKYFDAIDKLEAEEDYQEKADQILANLGKLGAGTDGTTETKRLELTQQLKDLEEERIKELRQQARDAITEDIDDQVSEINDKFDELLDNNRMLLAAMKGEMTNPQEYAQSLYNAKLSTGATDLELAQYVEEWKNGALSGYDINWDTIKTNSETNNIAINVSEAGLTNAETATFLELVKKMMTSAGYK